jgi:cyclopropane-fatty-acyl-phospholipid synthase
VLNRDYMNNLDTGYAWLNHLLDTLMHWGVANVLGRAKDNVAAHYDLSNEMFELFLDPTLTYSCALYRNEQETLEQAQLNKIRAMITKARVKATDHVLEIGSGWGALAMEAVRMTGCRVTSLTLSEEQKKLADARIAAAGMSDRIEIKLCDYRELEGTFDKIVSVEMLEQVGHEFLGTFFKCCERLLKPQGIAVIQVITLPDYRYAEYIKGCDFIQKYIFPGGSCLSVTAFADAVTAHTKFVIDDIENIGPHYARTLRTWRDNFNANADRIRTLGFDERFLRMWNYYFAYCEAGFATRTLGTIQVVLARPCTLELSEGIPQ